MSSQLGIMRSVVASIVASVLSTLCVTAGPNPTSLTILFQFDGPHSDKSVQEMQRELGSIMKESGLQIDWRDRGRMARSESFPNLVVVNFRGKCRMDPIPFLYDERGPLAFTYGADGTVLPFSEIECDKIRSTLHSAMWGGDYGRSDLLFGRALARVLAHELYHVLAGTRAHPGTGVARHALSGSQLISDELHLNPAELERMLTGR